MQLQVKHAARWLRVARLMLIHMLLVAHAEWHAPIALHEHDETSRLASGLSQCGSYSITRQSKLLC